MSHSAQTKESIGIVTALLTCSTIGPWLSADRIRRFLENKLSLEGADLNLEWLFEALVYGSRIRADNLFVAFANIQTVLRQRGIHTHCPRAFRQSPERRLRLQAARAHTEYALEHHCYDFSSSRRGSMLGTYLLDHGLLRPEALEKALTLQAMWGGRLGHALVTLGYLDVHVLSQALGEITGCASISKLHQPDASILHAVPLRVLARSPFVPISIPKRDWIRIVISDPNDGALLNTLEEQLNLHVEAVVAPEHLITSTIARILNRPLSERLVLEHHPVPSVPPQSTPNNHLGTPDEPTCITLQTPKIYPNHPSRYACTLLNCRTEVEVRHQLFRLWSREFQTTLSFDVDQGDLIGNRSCGLPWKVAAQFKGRRYSLHFDLKVSEQDALLHTLMVKKRGYSGLFFESANSHWLTHLVKLRPTSVLAGLPIQDARGDVLAVLIGLRPRVQRNSQQIELLRAGTRAAMRLVQARSALEQLHQHEVASATPSHCNVKRKNLSSTTY